ncbi:MAG TPA: sulfotransferase [Dehalococcoidia bacterium]|nr:sulfotransferase [Dehalococcoidia bacterium]
MTAPAPMILVCGTGRSGTSAVARLLHESGLAVGHDLIPADEFNPEGYYEERPLIQLDEAILAAVGLHRWFATASRDQLLRSARGYAREMHALAATATPAWKDPRFCWTLEAWLEVLEAPPRMLVCLRAPGEVVASTLRYYGLAGDEATRAAEHVWRTQAERLLDVVEAYRIDALAVEYGALLTSPAEAVEPIARFVGRPLDAALVRSDLRHHEAATTPPHLADLYARTAMLGADWRVTSGGAPSASAPSPS